MISILLSMEYKWINKLIRTRGILNGWQDLLVSVSSKSLMREKLPESCKFIRQSNRNHKRRFTNGKDIKLTLK